jgi:hypothetical protein
MRRNERGFALGVVLMSSIIFAIAAFGVLTLALSRTQQASFLGESSIRARYAAEMGLVKAMQKLWVDPDECFVASSPDYTIDTYNDADASNDTNIDIKRTPCPPAPPGSATTIEAKVVF